MLWAHASPQPKRHLDQFSCVCTDDCRVSLYWFACFPLIIVPSHVGIWTSCNTWFIGPTWVRNANGNLIVSAVFAGLTSVTDWQSGRQTDRAKQANHIGTLCGHLCKHSWADRGAVSVVGSHGPKASCVYRFRSPVGKGNSSGLWRPL